MCVCVRVRVRACVCACVVYMRTVFIHIKAGLICTHGLKYTLGSTTE